MLHSLQWPKLYMQSATPFALSLEKKKKGKKLGRADIRHKIGALSKSYCASSIFLESRNQLNFDISYPRLPPVLRIEAVPPLSLYLLSTFAFANGILVLGQRPAAHLQLRHPSKGVADEAVILGCAAGPAAQLGQLSFGVSIYYSGAICKRSSGNSSKIVVNVGRGVSQNPVPDSLCEDAKPRADELLKKEFPQPGIPGEKHSHPGIFYGGF